MRKKNQIKNYIIKPEGVTLDLLSAILGTIDVNTTHLGLDLLLIDQPGRCSWSLQITEDKCLIFKGLGLVYSTFTAVNWENFIMECNRGATYLRLFLAGERTLGLSYALQCKSGFPTHLFIDTWHALMQEQAEFEEVLEYLSPGTAQSLQREHYDSNTEETFGNWLREEKEAEDPLSDERNFLLGSLIGGAIGDAMGAPVELLSWKEIEKKYGEYGVNHFEKIDGGYGRITDDTQMTLFSLEAMIRCKSRQRDKGMVDHVAVFLMAYRRWALTQQITFADPAVQDDSLMRDGWLLEQEILHARRGPGKTCLAALENTACRGTKENRINNSKGCGGVMRAAPAGFFDIGSPSPFVLGCDLAAITHGHPSGYLSAGFLAELISHLRHGGSLLEAIFSALNELRKHPGHEEVSTAVYKALELATSHRAPHECIAMLGQGWLAEEALAIALFCSLIAENFYQGICLAVNHGGDSDSTGAITGNILGGIYGFKGLFEPWVDQIEMKEMMIEMVEDGLAAFHHGDIDCKKYPPH